MARNLKAAICQALCHPRKTLSLLTFNVPTGLRRHGVFKPAFTARKIAYRGLTASRRTRYGL